ncbi:GAF domain-containing protein, partial [Myxococcota bacterium]|nr:GAF domain-containing protein [Myxococcota bacterium]
MGQNIKILFVDDSWERISAILEQLRQFGLVPSFFRVESERLLADVLSKEAWDAVVCTKPLDALAGGRVAAVIAQSGKSLPCVCLSEREVDTVKNVEATSDGKGIIRCSLQELGLVLTSVVVPSEIGGGHKRLPEEPKKGSRRVKSRARETTLRIQHRTKKETDALLEATRAVIIAHDFRDAARQISRISTEVIGASLGAFYLKDDEERFQILCGESDFDAAGDSKSNTLVRSLWERVKIAKRPVWDKCSVDHADQSEDQIFSALLAPVVFENEVLGVFVYYNKTGGYGERDCEIAEAFSEIALLTIRDQRNRNALADSEEQYRNLFAYSSDAIVTLRPPDWHFGSCNPATVRLFNVRDEADFISRTLWEYSPLEQPDGVRSMARAHQIIELAMRNGNHFTKWQHRCPDGREFPATILLTRMEHRG